MRDPHRLRWRRSGTGSSHEFRNHLTVLLAAAGEIRTAAPPPSGARVADALAEAEWNVQRLNALVGFVDAALRDGTEVVADLDDVVERALRLAAPALGRTSVSLHKDRRTGVTNRGTALEALLAALLDRARPGGRQAGDRDGGRAAGLSRSTSTSRPRAGPCLSPIESDGRRPSADSLAVRAGRRPRRRGSGARSRTLPDAAGYLVRFS